MIPQPLVRFLYEGGGVIFVSCFLAFSLLATSEPIGTSLVFLAVFYRLAPRITAVNDNLYLARISLPWYLSWRQVYTTALQSAGRQAGTTQVPHFRRLSARAVAFSYPTRPGVLHDIDLELRKGTCTAIVGESGSGKTTLMDVLIGLLDPQAGGIAVDDVPMGRIDREWWRRQLGLVMQDSPMFSGTVVDNVALGDPRPDRGQVRRCLALAAAEGFVDAMPRALDTEVGERGSKLSGGQRQRLALARALYRDPGLLCLDEATAALDAESETLILSTVPQVKRDRAVLLVSHRLRTLAIADHIILLHEGRIVEQGSWIELTTGPTRFRRLVESQS
jgi:ABC-type multidrug transport system fused ATPase/permease subunit